MKFKPMYGWSKRQQNLRDLRARLLHLVRSKDFAQAVSFLRNEVAYCDMCHVYGSVLCDLAEYDVELYIEFRKFFWDHPPSCREGSGTND